MNTDPRGIFGTDTWVITTLEPGDCTKYLIYMSRLNVTGVISEMEKPNYVDLGALGTIDDGGFLVIVGSPSLPRAALFQDHGELHAEYVAEKFEISNMRTAQVITFMIGMSMKRPSFFKGEAIKYEHIFRERIES